MDGFSYVNLFETKGVEYIVIIIFLVLLIPFWLILNRKEEMKAGLRKILHSLSGKIKNIPHGLFYSSNHTWTYLERSGNAKMGLDDILLHITGRVTISYLKNPSDMITKGELVAEISQQGRKLRIHSPLSGRILEINPLLEEMPGLINEDPYENGWLFAIQPSAWREETHSYYLADEAESWFYREIERIKDFLAVKSQKYSPGLFPVTLQDGGELNESLLSDMPDELWQDFQQEFLDPK